MCYQVAVNDFARCGRIQGACEPQCALQTTPGNVKVKKTIWGIGVTWCPNLVHHFFSIIPEARWRETVRGKLLGSDISAMAMVFSLFFKLSRQKTSIEKP
jgi:hypothetical protein